MSQSITILRIAGPSVQEENEDKSAVVTVVTRWTVYYQRANGSVNFAVWAAPTYTLADATAAITAIENSPKIGLETDIGKVIAI